MKQQCIKFIKWVIDNRYVFLKGGDSEGWYKDSLDIEPINSDELYDLYMQSYCKDQTQPI